MLIHSLPLLATIALAPAAPAAPANVATQPAATAQPAPTAVPVQGSAPVSFGVQTELPANPPATSTQGTTSAPSPVAASEVAPATPVPPPQPAANPHSPHAGHGGHGHGAGDGHGKPGCDFHHGKEKSGCDHGKSGKGCSGCDHGKGGCDKGNCEGGCAGHGHGKSDCDGGKSGCDYPKAGCNHGKDDCKSGCDRDKGECDGRSGCPYLNGKSGCDRGKGEHGCAYSKEPKIKVGAEAWTRGEAFINPNLDTAADNKTNILQRIRVQATGTWGHLTVFGQLQDARTWGFEKSTVSNEGNVDLHQGYFQWQFEDESKKQNTYLRVGRQEIDLGNQRLIGSLNWAVTARSFDAVRLHTENRYFDVDAAWMVLRGRGPYAAPDSSDPAQPTNGTHVGALRIGVHPAKWLNVDALTLLNHDDKGQKANSNDIGNVGLRAYAKNIGGFEYEIEGNAQFGNNGGKAHQAWAAAGQAQYLFGVGQQHLNPGLRLGYVIASGDSAKKPNKSQEFFNFYPTNHIHYGLMDLFGWRNISQVEATAVLAGDGGKKGRLDLSYRFNQLQKSSGRWTNAVGGVVGVDPTNSENTLGHEVDLQLTMKPFKPVFVQAGYGVFIPTGAGRTLTGAVDSGPQHNLFLWLIYNL
jgi:hypothetical protein